MSYLAALAAAVLFGGGTILEATAARRSAGSENLDPRLMLRMVSQVAFLLSGLLGLLGVMATALALRHLPLFAVQAAVASSVAVSALIATVTHHEPLTPHLVAGIGGIVGGLTLLGLSASPAAPPGTSTAFRYGLVVAAGAGLLLAAAVGRRRGGTPLDVGLLGGTAGLLYGVGNIGLRVIHVWNPVDLVRDPAFWAAAIGGFGGVLVLATALQRGSVALVSGAVTTTETILPALVGVLLLGERPRAGWAPAAIVGFLCAVAGAVVLCRDVEPAEVPDHQPAP